MSSRSYRFGDYRIEPALREVWCGERLIALPPQVFDCLAYLVQHHDRAVSRDELVSAVWGKDEVSDTLLGQTILRIRRTLGDDAKDPHTLRTIARFGYRWVAPLEIRESGAAVVEQVEAIDTPAVVEVSPPQPIASAIVPESSQLVRIISFPHPFLVRVNSSWLSPSR